MILFHTTLGVFRRLRQSLNDFQSKISFFIYSHSFLISISQTIEQDLKNIDDRTMDSSNYFETAFYLFDRDCLYEQDIKNALTGKIN